MQKFLKRIGLFLVIAVILLLGLYYFWLWPNYTVPILMYHGISKQDNESLCVTPYNFLKQIAYIKKMGYNVMSLDELVEGMKSKRHFKHNTVVITFDDGYEDNYTNARCVLKDYDFPATIFLISNYIDKEGYLKSYQIQEMLKSGKITFGAHTRNHTYLPGIKDKIGLKDEIAGSKKDIEAKIGVKIDYFCYPTGGFTTQIKQIVKDARYKGACTTGNRSVDRFNKDTYELKRIKVKNSDFSKNPLSFWAKLSGYYNFFRKGNRPY